MRDPYEHLNLKQTERAEAKARLTHPILWWLAELVVFVEDPVGWIRDRRRLRALGYDPRRHTKR